MLGLGLIKYTAVQTYLAFSLLGIVVCHDLFGSSSCNACLKPSQTHSDPILI